MIFKHKHRFYELENRIYKQLNFQYNVNSKLSEVDINLWKFYKRKEKTNWKTFIGGYGCFFRQPFNLNEKVMKVFCERNI